MTIHERLGISRGPEIMACLFSVTIAACPGGSVPDAGPEGGRDAAADPRVDGGLADSGLDAGGGADGDGGEDGGIETGEDAGADAGDGARVDGGEDGGPDASLSPFALSRRNVVFNVELPATTPAGEAVYVMVMPVAPWSWEEHVTLTPNGLGMWTGTASLEEGALARYVYDRWDESTGFAAREDTREATSSSLRVDNRYLLVKPGLLEVNDVVETWRDVPVPGLTGTLTGTVVDAVTGAPLMDTNLSVAGINLATAHDGSFQVNCAAGEQRITAHRTSGDYMPTDATTTVAAGDEVSVLIQMVPAPELDVTFHVNVPADTPAGNEIRIAGNLFPLGARHGFIPNNPDINAATMVRTSPTTASLTLPLHTGTYVQYSYTLGSLLLGREATPPDLEYRSFVVGAAPETREEEVTAWGHPWQVATTFVVTVPANTTPSVPLAFRMGPEHWMSQTGPFEWTFTLYALPGELLEYEYVVGTSAVGGDGTPGFPDGRRTFVVPSTDTVQLETVTRWEHDLPAPRPPPSQIETTFRVTVPATSTSGATIRVVGNAPELAAGVAMAQRTDDPTVYEVTLPVASGPVTYHFDRGSSATASLDVHDDGLSHDGQALNRWVTAWADQPAPAARAGFITGVFPPDFMSAGFLSTAQGTYRRAPTINARYVAISSVWSYGVIDPLPVMESRQVRAPSVLALREEILLMAEKAHAEGLEVILMPQFNMEQSPGGIAALLVPKSQDWWRAWIKEARRLWLWNANVAEDIGAHSLLLPGFVFHVFTLVGVDDTDPFRAEFDNAMADLVTEVRSVYGGKLIISGGVLEYNFPGLADYMGLTTFDLGSPALGPGASAEEWRAGYEALFTQKADPIHARWNVPILLYQVHTEPDPSDPDVTGDALQAKKIEAIFRAIDARPWMMGTMAWDYAYVDAPLHNGQGTRARLGEAVFAKYYGVFDGP